jgi:urease accessory protein
MVAVARESARGGRATVSPARLTSFLSVLQLSDSAFPSGRYTLSYGLEAFAQSAELRAPNASAALLGLLHDSIRFGVAPSDGVALACAHRAASSEGVDLELVGQADERLTAVKLAREAREASVRTGRALLLTGATAFAETALTDYAELVQRRIFPGNHAVVLGLLSACLGVQRLEAVAGELYAYSSGWVAAPVRLGLIDHRAAQGLLHHTRPVIAAAALKTVNCSVTQISSCTPLLDVMAMRHEDSELRLFAS